MESAPAPLDIHRYLRTLWRRKLPFLAALVIIPAVVYWIASQGEKVYESSVVMQVQGTAIDTTLFAQSGVGSSGVQNAQSIAVAARLVQTTAVANRAATYLKRQPATPGALLSQISVSADSDTGFLTITARAPDPSRAAEVASAFSKAIVDTRTQQATARLDSTIVQLVAQVNSIKDKIARRQLSGQLQQLRALRASQGSNAVVVEPAAPNPNAVSPKPGKAAKFGVIIGLLVALGLVALLESLDRRMRDPSELEELSGLPLLSAIPNEAFPGEKNSHAAEEAFYTLRASLTYFNVDREITSLLITSPAQGDGKTTVAVNLAIAAAKGGKDVILVDADLRRPSVAKRLSPEVIGPGLGAVLTGQAELDGSLRELPIEGPSHGRLRVLSGTSAVPNPSELTGSQKMADTLAALEGQCDMVIVDTNPVLAVADAIPLLERVSGVLVVARMGRTSREAVERLVTVITSGNGSPLGIVATGASMGGIYGYGYGYGYGYAPSGNGFANGGGTPVSTNGKESVAVPPKDTKRRIFGRRSEAPTSMPES